MFRMRNEHGKGAAIPSRFCTAIALGALLLLAAGETFASMSATVYMGCSANGNRACGGDSTLAVAQCLALTAMIACGATSRYEVIAFNESTGAWTVGNPANSMTHFSGVATGTPSSGGGGISQATFDSLAGRVSTNETSITNLQGRVTTAEGNITTLQEASGGSFTPYDYANGGVIWAFAFSFTVGLWWLTKNIGLIMKAIKSF